MQFYLQRKSCCALRTLAARWWTGPDSFESRTARLGLFRRSERFRVGAFGQDALHSSPANGGCSRAPVRTSSKPALADPSEPANPSRGTRLPAHCWASHCWAAPSLELESSMRPSKHALFRARLSGDPSRARAARIAARFAGSGWIQVRHATGDREPELLLVPLRSLERPLSSSGVRCRGAPFCLSAEESSLEPPAFPRRGYGAFRRSSPSPSRAWTETRADLPIMRGEHRSVTLGALHTVSRGPRSVERSRLGQEIALARPGCGEWPRFHTRPPHPCAFEGEPPHANARPGRTLLPERTRPVGEDDPRSRANRD